MLPGSGHPGPLEFGLACQAGVLIALSLAGFRSFREDPADRIGGRPLPAPFLLGWSAAGACLLYGVSIRIGLAWLAAGGEAPSDDQHPLFRVAFGSPGSVPWLLPLVAVLGPISEELFFRGFFQGRLRSRLGPVAAIAITAIAFGLMHPFSARYVAGTAGLGLALGYLRERSGSLGPPIAAHCIFNALNFLLVILAGESIRLSE